MGTTSAALRKRDHALLPYAHAGWRGMATPSTALTLDRPPLAANTGSGSLGPFISNVIVVEFESSEAFALWQCLGQGLVGTDVVIIEIVAAVAIVVVHSSSSLRELVGANERHPEDRRVRKRLGSRVA